MFFLGYVRSELLRRRARTILTLVGLGLGVALVVAISAISRGLDHAQKKLPAMIAAATPSTVAGPASLRRGVRFT